ncbi:MAG TPA: hypothetical protein VEI97_18150, partial [bacterium]|nr:hypothetical protein [bacterium]
MPRCAARPRYLLAALLLSAATACSSPSPTSPAPAGTGNRRPLGEQGPLPLAADPAAVALAAFDLVVDPGAGTAALVPLRGVTAIGDAFSEVGLMPAFDGRFGDHFDLDRIERIDGETMALDFTTSHPFTAQARPDLGIFNVKLWVALEGPSATVNGVPATPGVVRNAEGYGTMWASTTTSPAAAGLPSVQPYIILNEDPSSAPFDWRNPVGWNVLFPGQSTTDTLELTLDPSAPPLRVRLFLTADYGQSAVRTTRQNPQYSLPEFAGNAPWKVQVTETVNGLEAGSPTSNAEFRVDIWDWKHGQGLGSDVLSARLYLPDIRGAAPVDLGLSGTGSDPTPLTATALALNSAGAGNGSYWG